jgi:transcriptional regulator with XRE-family HTH domain
MASDLGSKLRVRRERQGLTLRQIAARTKIPLHVLESLERNETSRLPGGIFGRAFVRTYASELGLDPEEAIRDFLAQLPVGAVAAGHRRPDQIEDNVALESDRRIATTALRLLILSVPLAVLVAYVASSPERRIESHERSLGQSPREALSPANPASGGAVPTSTPLVVEVVANRRSRILAAIDDQDAAVHRLAEGERQTFTVQRELRLEVDDAAGVTWTLNGRPGRSLGMVGELVSIRLTPDNYREYLVTP